MKNLFRSLPAFVAPAALAAVAFLAPRPAHAGLAACGNIDVKANATCTVTAKGGCTAQCEPVRFEAACAGKLYAQCDGQCNVAVDASCTASCGTDCLARCKVDPGKLDCRADCSASCTADCSGKCASSGNKTECEASCKATCGGKCDASCTSTPPSATCEAKCEVSCSGSCQAKANVDCQVNCQAKGYVDCKASLTGGCKTQCEKPEGALFCDGQYVDTGNNLQSCIDALKAQLNVKVETSGTSSCDGGACTAEGNAKVSSSCALSPGHDEGAPSPAWLLAFGAAIGVGAARRRRPRS